MPFLITPISSARFNIETPILCSASDNDNASICKSDFLNFLASSDIRAKETLKFFSKNAIITNSARGDMIDDDAMIEALKNKKIFALGLDVYNNEPNIHPEYLKLSNVFILPHLGSATKKTRTDMANLAIDNLEEFFKTGKSVNCVN